eukprot:jgi/Chlat1/4687/Chrsp3S05643
MATNAPDNHIADNAIQHAAAPQPLFKRDVPPPPPPPFCPDGCTGHAKLVAHLLEARQDLQHTFEKLNGWAVQEINKAVMEKEMLEDNLKMCKRQLDAEQVETRKLQKKVEELQKNLEQEQESHSSLRDSYAAFVVAERKKEFTTPIKRPKGAGQKRAAAAVSNGAGVAVDAAPCSNACGGQNSKANVNAGQVEVSSAHEPSASGQHAQLTPEKRSIFAAAAARLGFAETQQHRNRSAPWVAELLPLDDQKCSSNATHAHDDNWARSAMKDGKVVLHRRPIGVDVDKLLALCAEDGWPPADEVTGDIERRR